MAEIVRNEHAAVLDYLQAQAAAQSRDNAAADSAYAQAVADADPAGTQPETVAAANSAGEDKASHVLAVQPPARSRSRGSGAIAVSELIAPRHLREVAQADIQAPITDPVVITPAPKPSLFSRTVHATLHVVSSIGGIPNWVAAVGGHIGGGGSTDGSTRLTGTAS